MSYLIGAALGAAGVLLAAAAAVTVLEYRSAGELQCSEELH